VADDSYVLDFSTDPACTSIDMTAVTNLPTTLPWLEGTNRVVYTAEDSQLSGSNVVKGSACSLLTVNEAWGTFRPAKAFTATTATYTCNVNGQHIVQLPFAATVPAGVKVYTLTADLQLEAVSGTVPAGQPLLVEAQGEVTFQGSGEVAYTASLLTDDVLPISTTAIGRTTLNSHRSSVTTNLQGQQVDASYRGIVISNGHKFYQK